MGIISSVLVLEVEMLVVNIFCLFLFFILTIRRLHDLNFRGWLSLFPPLVVALCILVLISFAFSPRVPLIIAIPLIAGLLIAGAFILAMLFVPGTRGPNRFGEA